MGEKIVNFLTKDIWRIKLRDLSRPRSFFIKQLRIIILALREFAEDKCQLRASALTFYSLLSIVPVVAMAFGIAKGFGFEKVLEKQLLNKVSGQEQVFTQVFDFAKTLLENTKGGLVAGIGVVVLFWTVIKVLTNIERSFNDIWGIKKTRPLGRKFSDYLSVMVICPILLIVSSSITVFITTQTTMIIDKFVVLGVVAPFIFFVLKILPYGMIAILFTFIYIFMPNTKVNFKSALIGGVIGGVLYVLSQWAYITFQVGAGKFNAIYGSFAALPLFLIWLQLSWLIVLFGAEISFAHQNVDMFEFEPDCLNASNNFKKLLSLRITQLIVKNFTLGLKPLEVKQISQTLEIPTRLLRQILFELVESRILNETKTEDYKEVGYQPAIDIDLMSIQYVINALENRGTKDIPVVQTKELDVLSQSLNSFFDLSNSSEANKLLKDM